MKVKIIVKLKPGVLDPQGQAIQRSLNIMGHDEVVAVRQGKYFELEFNGRDQEKVRETALQICDEILSNPLIENYEIQEIS